MDKVITEIIIGAVVLALLISIIPIYRSSAALVSAAGQTVDANENIKEVTFGRIPEKGDVVYGGYLLEFIRYSTEKYETHIKVEFFDEMYVFRKDRNLDSLNKIENNMMFEVKESILDGNKLELYFAFCDEEFISGEKVAWMLTIVMIFMIGECVWKR